MAIILIAITFIIIIMVIIVNLICLMDYPHHDGRDRLRWLAVAYAVSHAVIIIIILRSSISNDINIIIIIFSSKFARAQTRCGLL